MTRKRKRAIIQTSIEYIRKAGARKGLIGKPVRIRHGPATVKLSQSKDVTGVFPGRRKGEEAKSGELPVFVTV